MTDGMLAQVLKKLNKASIDVTPKDWMVIGNGFESKINLHE
jgi:hypothetical protein